MANANEILDNLSDDEIELYSRNTDIEEHIVVGLDRFIEVPDMLKRIAVQYDNKVETVTFDCPRYWDEHDLSTMYIYINYMRSDTVKGRNLCKNVRIDEEDPDLIHFEWNITNEITVAHGPIIFLVCALTTDENGMENLHWNSERNTQMYVSEGLESDDAELIEYADIINDLLTRMDNLIAANTPILDKSLTMEGFAAEAKAVGDILRNFEESLMIEHFSEQFKTLYITEEKNEDTFDLGEWYAEGCMFDVRVNGFDLNETEYTINPEENKVVLTKPLDVIGTPVELLITRDVSIKKTETYEKLRGPKGKRGYSVSGVSLDDNYNLIFNFEDGLDHNAGNIHTIKDATVQNGQLHIEYTDGTSKDIGNLYDDAYIAKAIKAIDDKKVEAINNVKTQETTSIGAVASKEASSISEVNKAKDTAVADGVNDINKAKDSAVLKATQDINDVKSEVVSDAISDINSSKDLAINVSLEAIETKKTTSISEITTAKDTAVSNANQAIESKKTDSVTAVTQARDEAINSFNQNAAAQNKRIDDLEDQIGKANGIAQLGSDGKVPASQLPAYVDDVLEFTNRAAFPAIGEASKIYVAKDTNLTYRWSGTDYVEISKSLALGETDSTAYPGNKGKVAYDHAMAKGSAFQNGLYKITTNAQGHVTSATPVTKNDITGLNIPEEDSIGVAYGTCTTAGNVKDKVITLIDADKWKLKAGSVIGVKFTNTNTYNSTVSAPVTLNVNNTGAKQVWYNASISPTGSNAIAYGTANRVTYYMYDGTNWVFMGWSADDNTTYSPVNLGFGYGTCSTAETTLAKTVAITNYLLQTYGTVSIKFSNNVPANSTLNINDKGAKNIFYNGAKITDGVIKAGDTATFRYDGTQYQLISVDTVYEEMTSAELQAIFTEIGW